jgi:hypothetical protein
MIWIWGKLGCGGKSGFDGTSPKNDLADFNCIR